MTSYNAFAAQTCIVGVVVTNGSNMALYFPEAGNVNAGSNADMHSDVAGLSSIDLDIGPILNFPHYYSLLAAILDFSVM